jgi:lysozyme
MRKLFLLLVTPALLGAHNSNINPWNELQAKVFKKVNLKVKERPISFVYGIDISHWQGDELTTLNLPDSIQFVICKATEGVTFVDSKLKSNKAYLDNSKKLIAGYYHFYRCNRSAIKQARFFVETAGPFSKKDFPPIIDLEHLPGSQQCRRKADIDSILVFLEEVERLTKRRPIIYTNRHFGSTLLTDEVFAYYPLWIAHYSKKKPSLFGHWEDWVMWQKSDKFKIGVIKNDLNVFNGDQRDLKKFIRKSKGKKS